MCSLPEAAVQWGQDRGERVLTPPSQPLNYRLDLLAGQPRRQVRGAEILPGKSRPYKEGGRGAKERSRGGEGVKVERGMGSQEEGWKKTEVRRGAVSAGGCIGQKMRVTFLVRLLAGAVTGQLRGKRPQMVNDVPPGSAPTSNHQGTRVRTECKGLRKKEKKTGRRSTDERKRTTTDDGQNDLSPTAPLAPAGPLRPRPSPPPPPPPTSRSFERLSSESDGNVQLPGPSKGKSEKGWVNEKGGERRKGMERRRRWQGGLRRNGYTGAREGGKERGDGGVEACIEIQ